MRESNLILKETEDLCRLTEICKNSTPRNRRQEYCSGHTKRSKEWTIFPKGQECCKPYKQELSNSLSMKKVKVLKIQFINVKNVIMSIVLGIVLNSGKLIIFVKA